MNGSDDDRTYCSGAYCKRTHHYERTGEYDEHVNPIMRSPGGFQGDDWYCDDCWAVVTGKQRIADLEAENARMAKRIARLESRIRPGVLARVFRRVFVRGSRKGVNREEIERGHG